VASHGGAAGSTQNVTDVPVDTICTELEHDVASTVGGLAVPPLLRPVDGYLG
jgi:hypothetical protein